MIRERTRLLKKILFLMDLFLIALCFHLSHLINLSRLGEKYSIFETNNLIFPAIILWGLVLVLIQDCYEIRLKKTSSVIFSVFKVSLISGGLLLSYVFVFKLQQESRFQLALFTAMSFISIGALRLLIISVTSYIRSSGFNYYAVLIVGLNNAAQNIAARILANSYIGWKIIGFVGWEDCPPDWHFKNIKCLGKMDDLPVILKSKQVDRVIIAASQKELEKVENSIRLCEKMGVEAAVLINFFPSKISKLRIDLLFDMPFALYDVTPRVNMGLLFKSFIDKLFAFLSLILLLPFIMIVIIAIKLTSDGPAIFKQIRCGLNGRKFTLYKFRTMIKDAEDLKEEVLEQNERRGPAFKIKDDPRITRIGRLLRKSSIDELPQLLNVLKGEMSIVGPRPPLPEEVILYDDWHRRKLSMKPGITGLWQVKARGNTSFEKWMRLDLEYINNWSIWLDFKIVIMTIPAVIKGIGAS